MGTLDVGALLAERFGVVDVELPTLGGSVKVRPLTRSEALKLRGVELEVDEMERQLLALAMVEPKLTEDQVRQWQDVSPAGELEPVAETIIRISGMAQDAGKAAYADFRE
jgi:hypothetical protein